MQYEDKEYIYKVISKAVDAIRETESFIDISVSTSGVFLRVYKDDFQDCIISDESLTCFDAADAARMTGELEVLRHFNRRAKDEVQEPDGE